MVTKESQSPVPCATSSLPIVLTLPHTHSLSWLPRAHHKHLYQYYIWACGRTRAQIKSVPSASCQIVKISFVSYSPRMQHICMYMKQKIAMDPNPKQPGATGSDPGPGVLGSAKYPRHSHYCPRTLPVSWPLSPCEIINAIIR